MIASKTAAEWLSLIAEHAPQLRDVGVLSVSIDDVTFTLAPALAKAVEIDAQPDDEPKGVFDDPATFGIPNGQRQHIPRLSRDRNEQ